ETATGVEPIDSVQVLFDQWLTTSVEEFSKPSISIFPNPASESFQLQVNSIDVSLRLNIFDATGRRLHQERITSPTTTIKTDFMSTSGLVFYQLVDENGDVAASGKLLIE
ncbi:MAG: T9SS type A sorting domain-containing protein, partial [Bacteroidota bacterium]